MEDKKRKLISVCISTYEMGGKGPTFLAESLDVIVKQTFRDFDVVISDNSKSSVIRDVCDAYRDKLTIFYYQNEDPLRGMCSNINNGIKRATGKIIKLLFLDDLLYDENSLQLIADNFDLERDTWLATACKHTTDGVNFFREHHPHYNDAMHLGKNTIGSPSVLAIKNDNPMLFDPGLRWLLDCDYYKRYYEKYGSPIIVQGIGVVIRTGGHQMTSLLHKTVKNAELKTMQDRYKRGPVFPIDLSSVTLVAVSGIDPVGAINALQLSTKNIIYHDVVLISHTKPQNLPNNITFKQCRPTELTNLNPKNKDDYSRFMAYNLCDYIKSDYSLVVHNDAYVLRPEGWDKAFLKYDYIGAPWPKRLKFFTNEGVNVRVGNGGFSLRSRRCLNILNELSLPFTDNGMGFYNEDGILCVYYRKKLEDAGMRFAPVELAARFSHELDCEESVAHPFGFHNSKIVLPVWLWPVKALLRKLRIVL